MSTEEVQQLGLKVVIGLLVVGVLVICVVGRKGVNQFLQHHVDIEALFKRGGAGRRAGICCLYVLAYFGFLLTLRRTFDWNAGKTWKSASILFTGIQWFMVLKDHLDGLPGEESVPSPLYQMAVAAALLLALLASLAAHALASKLFLWWKGSAVDTPSLDIARSLFN